VPPDFRQPHHLPKVRGDDGANPDKLPRQRRGKTPQMHGRYPDYDCLEHVEHWDELTRKTVVDRVERVPELRFFGDDEAATLRAFCDVVLAQDAEPRIPVLAFIDQKLAEGNLDGYQYADMPDDRQVEIADSFAEGSLEGRVWEELNLKHAWGVVMRSVLAGFYSHPWAWNEIGFGGPAYPRGYARLGIGLSETWEGEEVLDIDPVSDVKERGLE